MNYIRDKNITTTPINGEFYKIFINFNKNKIPELIKYIEEHKKSDQNNFFNKEFESAFISFQLSLCGKN